MTTLLATVVAMLCVPGAASAADPSATLGVYVGANKPLKVAQYEQWRGRPVARVLDFLADDDWSKIAWPTWWTNGWAASPYKDRLVYSVPMLPRYTGTMQQGATGAYNWNFVELAKTLRKSGQPTAVIRLGWEFNGSWYRWAAGPNPQAYIRYYRQIVTAMRSVTGTAFTFDWSATMGPSAMPADAAYPGDAYVDTIGLDVYDQYWGPNPTDPEARWNSYVSMPYGLAWHRDFAAAHGKPMSFPEWGVIIRSDGHGGGDSPTFIQHMRDWIAANNVAYSMYFEYATTANKSALMTGMFSQSAAKFLQLFGAP